MNKSLICFFFPLSSFNPVPQRVLVAEPPVTEGMGRENLAAEGLGPLSLAVFQLSTAFALLYRSLVELPGVDVFYQAESPGDDGDIALIHDVALGAERFPHPAAEVDPVGRLHLATAFGGLAKGGKVILRDIEDRQPAGDPQ